VNELSGPAIYEFAGFRLQVRQRLLFSADRRPVPLSPRAFETLVMFVERAGDMLDKSELMERVWPKTVVEENSLNQCISQLRRALGERPGEHRFIVTEPGRGYRFVAAVSAVADAAALNRGTGDGTPEQRSGATAPERSIAVLPFTNLTGDRSKEYLCDGIADELIHTLSRVPGLKIPARSSSFAYKGRQVGARQIGEELRVKSVLEGSVRSAGERIRVTVQLVDAETGYQSWSQSLDRKFEDLFALQDELAREVARTLKLHAEPNRDTPHDLEAYVLMLQAKSLVRRPSEANLREAIALLKRAIERDPNQARAYAWLALAYADCLLFEFPVSDALTEAERNAEIAANLDPSIADVHAVLGVLGTMRGKWLESAAGFETAMALSPDPAWRSWRASLHTLSVGHVREALPGLEAGLQTAPSLTALLLAIAHTLLMNDAEARRYADLAVSLGQPRTLAPMPDLYAQLAWRAHRFDEAASALNNGVGRLTQTPGAAEAITLMCAALGGTADRSSAVAALRELEMKLEPQGIDPLACKKLILWYTMLGAPDVAHDCAARCLDTYAKLGTVGTAWAVLWMPEMRPFRTHPRFQEFAQRLGFPPYWEQYGPPDGAQFRDGKLTLN